MIVIARSVKIVDYKTITDYKDNELTIN